MEMTGYRAVREGVGVIERADLAHLRLFGRDPVKMLQGLVTNDLAGTPPNRAVYAAVLTPKGRMVADVRAVKRLAPGGTEVWLDLPAGALAGLGEHLKKFVPPMFAGWEDLSERVGMLGVYGPRAPAALEPVLDLPVPDLPEDGLFQAVYQGHPVLAVRTLYTGQPGGYDLRGEPERLESLRAELVAAGARPAGPDALETLRIEAGRPRYGVDLTGETILAEAFQSSGLMERAVSFSKGCYTGQEVVVRIAHRGHVNRHLRGFLLGERPAPAPGTPLTHPATGKQAGWTTSTASSPALGQTIALGYLRRELGPGDEVLLYEEPVKVAELPFPRP
ncbi:MAG: YgfZ/GcvT domain-containing protein [Longimicrobiaceae bacterium]